jgi:hypothetical protein
MIKYIILIAILFFYKGLFGQTKEPLSIQVEPSVSNNDSFSIYKITLENYSDSITCIMRSPIILLGIGQGPLQLLPVENDSSKSQFSLGYAAGNDRYVLEGSPYRADIILPYHALSFEIRVPASDKEQFLTIKYFNLYDLNYRQFTHSMRNLDWFVKYLLNVKVVVLPARKGPKSK